MKALELYDLWQKGCIDKRLYWQIMGEKHFMLFEIQELIKANTNVESITISSDGTVLNTNGIKIYFDFDQTMCRAESILIDTEREDFSFLNSIIDSLSCSGRKVIIFDIGANIGRVSLMMAKHNKTRKRKDYFKREIYAFEPVKTTFIALQKNLALNGDIGFDIKPFNIGFYSKEEDLKFFVPAENEAASLRPIEDEFYMQQLSESGTFVKKQVKEQSCQVTTLDSFTKNNKVDYIDFMKVDVEGAELFVFNGGETVFKDLKPAVYTEMLRKHSKRFGYHPNDIIQFFRKMGYLCFTESNGELHSFFEMDDNTEEANFFFLHKEKHGNLIKKFKNK